ncbi:MAG: cysteine dioxygenase family protein, partial [Kutzneria sp.]|nr:cysteine dioxygenase family protein [Kutzneria sp.]
MFAVPENTVVSTARRALPQPTRIVREVVADRERWDPLLRYDPYERWTALIERTSCYEVWLMTWLPGQHTDLHDHGGAEGAFTVVSGALTEFVAGTGHTGRTTHAVRAGQSRVFGPRHVHQVGNQGLDPAVSVHVFGPERRRMTVYP